MQKEILKQCCHKCDDYSKSWEVTCRDCECHRLQKHKVGLHGAVVMPTQKGDICVECGKEEGPHEHEWYTPVGLKDYQICMKCEIPKSREKCSHNKSQPPQPKVKATCLSLDCPERTGGECRYQPTEPQKECEHEWGTSEPNCFKCKWEEIMKFISENQDPIFTDLYDVLCEIEFDLHTGNRIERMKNYIRRLLSQSKQETEEKMYDNWYSGEVEEKIKQETLDEIVKMIKETKERFRCAACDGANCGHTLGCQALSDLIDKIKNIKCQ